MSNVKGNADFSPALAGALLTSCRQSSRITNQWLLDECIGLISSVENRSGEKWDEQVSRIGETIAHEEAIETPHRVAQVMIGESGKVLSSPSLKGTGFLLRPADLHI
jgi:hypothetical protein